MNRKSFLLAASMLLALGGCATATPQIPDALIEWRCDSWVPDDLKDDVPGAALPDGSAGSYVIGFDAQTGQLDQANDEKQTVVTVGSKCEDIRASIMRTFQRRSFLQRITPWTE